MWYFWSMVTQSAGPLQTVKGININNLLEFVKPFHLNKLGFYQFSEKGKIINTWNWIFQILSGPKWQHHCFKLIFGHLFSDLHEKSLIGGNLKPSLYWDSIEADKLLHWIKKSNYCVDTLLCRITLCCQNWVLWMVVNFWNAMYWRPLVLNIPISTLYWP